MFERLCEPCLNMLLCSTPNKTLALLKRIRVNILRKRRVSSPGSTRVPIEKIKGQIGVISDGLLMRSFRRMVNAFFWCCAVAVAEDQRLSKRTSRVPATIIGGWRLSLKSFGQEHCVWDSTITCRAQASRRLCNKEPLGPYRKLCDTLRRIADYISPINSLALLYEVAAFAKTVSDAPLLPAAFSDVNMLSGCVEKRTAISLTILQTHCYNQNLSINS